MAYTKTTWNDGDVITKEKMNNLEAGVEAVDKAIPTAATTAKAGIMKQSAMVDNVASADASQSEDAPTKEEFDKVVAVANEAKKQINALNEALKTAGIMATS